MSDSRAYLLAIVAVVAVGVGAVIAVDLWQPPGVNSTLTTRVIEMLTMTLAVLIDLLRTSATARKVEEVKRDTKEVKEEMQTVREGVQTVKESTSGLAPPK